MHMFSSEEQYFLFLAAKLLAGELTTEERIALDDLLRADKSKRELLAYLEQKHGEEDLEAEISYEKSRPIELTAVEDVTARPFIGRHKVKLLSIAASLFIVFGVLSFWFIKNDKKVAEDTEWQTIATGKGERKSIKLSDGSEVWLNNESVLRLKAGFGKTDRVLELVGEGYFAIAKNPNLPLKIKTAYAEVQVLGTKFNLRALPDENMTTTSLIEGKVRLKVMDNKQEKLYELLPGNKVSVINQPVSTNDHRSKHVVLQPKVTFAKLDLVDTEVTETLWMKNRLVFNGEGFEVVAKKMERWFGKPIVVENERLAKEPITGIFDETTCEEVLNVIKRTGTKLNYYTQNDTLYVK